jgi:hypothetical protein
MKSRLWTSKTGSLSWIWHRAARRRFVTSCIFFDVAHFMFLLRVIDLRKCSPYFRLTIRIAPCQTDGAPCRSLTTRASGTAWTSLPRALMTWRTCMSRKRKREPARLRSCRPLRFTPCSKSWRTAACITFPGPHCRAGSSKGAKPGKDRRTCFFGSGPTSNKKGDRP